METKLSELTNSVINDISKKKDDIIMTKILEVNPDFDIKKEEQLRFKTILREVVGSKETFYYNNGTTFGHRLITFVNPRYKNPEQNLSTTKIEYELKYY